MISEHDNFVDKHRLSPSPISYNDESKQLDLKRQVKRFELISEEYGVALVESVPIHLPTIVAPKYHMQLYRGADQLL